MKMAMWLPLFRSYLAMSLVGHLAWETAQLPLYTIFWNEAPVRIAFATVHCTIGDMLIAAATLAISLIIVANVPRAGKRVTPMRVAATVIPLGASYTVFSEWMNTTPGAWAYTAAIPNVPVLGTGLAPLLQWILVPAAALGMAARKQQLGREKTLASAQCDPRRPGDHPKEIDHG